MLDLFLVAPSIGTRVLVTKMAEDLMTPFTREKRVLSRLRQVPAVVKDHLLVSLARDRTLRSREQQTGLHQCINLAGKGWSDEHSAGSFQTRLRSAINDKAVRDGWIDRYGPANCVLALLLVSTYCRLVCRACYDSESDSAL